MMRSPEEWLSYIRAMQPLVAECQREYRELGEPPKGSHWCRGEAREWEPGQLECARCGKAHSGRVMLARIQRARRD